MNCRERLNQFKKLVDLKLEELLPADETVLSRAMRYAVLSGGKRFRPLLTLATTAGLKADWEKAVSFACAIEFIHNYSLVHDDLPLMDDDDLRRGQPTCHKAFGEEVALLVGDALLTLAFEVLAHARLLPEHEAVRGKIVGVLSRQAGYAGMIGGQFLDVTLSPNNISREKFLMLMQKKTGALIQASVKIGAYLGHASPLQEEALAEYGKNVGLAFQTRDDIKDWTEDTAGDRPVRANSVAIFGLEQAEKNLQQYINSAVTALERIAWEAGELRCMADMLQLKKKG